MSRLLVGASFCAMSFFAPACASPAPARRAEADIVKRSPEDEVRAVVAAFCESVGRADFRNTWTLLGAQWRAQYSPDSLGADFEKEPLARARVSRACAAQDGSVALSSEDAKIMVGQARVLGLKLEDGSWKITQLE